MRPLRSPHNAIILLGYALGAVALKVGLPHRMPPSLELADRTVWLGGVLVAFLLPTAADITDRLLRRLCVRPPVDEATASHVLAVYDAIMLRLIAFIVSLHAVVLAGLTGMLWGRPWAGRIVPLLVGVALIGVGNLLPLTRPNLAIGIRVGRTLSDRALWMRTHRAAGYMTVGFGLVIAFSALAVPAPAGPRMILIVGPAAILGAAYLIRSARAAEDGAPAD